MPASSLDLTNWLTKPLTVVIEVDGKDEASKINIKGLIKKVYSTVGSGTRYISGIMTAAQFLYEQGRSSYYSVTIKPFLASATLKIDYTIFQDKRVINVLDEALQAYLGEVDKRFKTNYPNRYPVRDYLSQFGESDYDFVCRLTAEYGINPFFVHSDTGHKLVLSDDVIDHYNQENVVVKFRRMANIKS